MSTTHECDESCLITNRDFTTVCRVTGRCYNQYINSNVFYNDVQTTLIPVGPQKTHMLLNTQPQPSNDTSKRQDLVSKRNGSSGGGGGRSCKTTKRKRVQYPRPKPHFDAEAVRSNIRQTVCTLLYSQNREFMDADSSSVLTTIDQHYKKRRSVTKVAYDSSVVDQVVDDVYQVISMVFSQRPFLKIAPIIIGSLYLMQHGKRFKSFEIRQNPYLHQHLPSVSDLPNFSYQKNLVRIGSNVIIRCARSL